VCPLPPIPPDAALDGTKPSLPPLRQVRLPSLTWLPGMIYRALDLTFKSRWEVDEIRPCSPFPGWWWWLANFGALLPDLEGGFSLLKLELCSLITLGAVAV
jgi:hypothetical protein